MISLSIRFITSPLLPIFISADNFEALIRAASSSSPAVNFFNTLSARRMASVGINKVRWIHGFPKEPRPYHARVWDGKSGKKDGHPNGLNGFIFSLDNPPIIDEKTGERGLPGRLPFCSCRMEPVIDEYE